MNIDRLSSDQTAYLAALRDDTLGILAAKRAVRRPAATFAALRRRHLITLDGTDIVLTPRGRRAIGVALPIPASVAPVAMVGRPYYDEVAWRAECRVPRCGWHSDPIPAPHGVEEAPAAIKRIAGAHGAEHTRAAEAFPAHARQVAADIADAVRDAEVAGDTA